MDAVPPPRHRHGPLSFPLSFILGRGLSLFHPMQPTHRRNAQGVILVYDPTRRDTFENLETWIKEMDTYKNVPNMVKLLVANKVDKPKEEWQVQTADGETFARSHGMVFIECSAKTNSHIRQAFEEIVAKMLDVAGGQTDGQTGLRLQQQQQQKNHAAHPMSYCC